MVLISKYLTKEEVIGWVQMQNPRKTVDDIPDDLMNKAHVKVDAEIVNKGCFGSAGLPTESDDMDFLKYATQMFALALLAKAGMITQTSGEILSNKFGDVMYQFQRTNPLFFFATGASEPFMDLLPYETLRMYAYSFIKAYCKYRYFKTYGHKRPKALLVVDQSSRGAYWNQPYGDNDAADADFGDLLPEEDYV